MSPYILTGLLLLAVLATVILAFAFAPRRREPDIYKALADELFEPSLTGNGYHRRKHIKRNQEMADKASRALGDGYHRRNMSFERIEQDRTLTGGKPPARKASSSF